MSVDSVFQTPNPVNEPIRAYRPGDAETKSLKSELKSMRSEKIEIPLMIGGREIRTGNLKKIVMPHEHGHVLAEFHLASEKELELSVEAALKAKKDWESLSSRDRTAVFLRAAELLAGSYRDKLNASTMLGQSKNVFQAEIDAACELIDFFRFNARYYEDIQKQQPLSADQAWNSIDYRPLEGFVAAITPFNFTSIAANLCAAPALVGNCVVWKPSDTQMLSAYYTMKLFEEAGLPPGVINMVAADGPLAGKTLLSRRELAGIHFTGSTQTFQTLYQTVGQQISSYQSYPRLVGETGGKDFIFAHSSANLDELAVALARGAFEFQGQKCSAASRAYIPRSVWNTVRDKVVAIMRSFKMGTPEEFSNFINAVIDERAFDKIKGYIDHVQSDSKTQVLEGGEANKSEGYFIQPTLVETADPKSKTMVEEIFGPVLTVYPYEDSKFIEVAEECNRTSPYALTGAVFGHDRKAIQELSRVLRHSAGNFYINDKPTGAVVGQQPFGGGRASGTNDKAGSPLNLYRWLSLRTIKENQVPPRDWRYPFLG